MGAFVIDSMENVPVKVVGKGSLAIRNAIVGIGERTAITTVIALDMALVTSRYL